jgi:hypothetical protein
MKPKRRQARKACAVCEEQAPYVASVRFRFLEFLPEAVKCVFSSEWDKIAAKNI